MGERKLNFNAPLLSVRRFSSPSASEDRRNRKRIENPLPNRRLALPLCGSDLELDQVTKPVAIPFNWEKIPGRPKDGSGPEPHPHKEASVTPRLPPGRFMDIIKQPSKKESDDTDRFRCQIVPYSSNDKGLSRGGINEEGGSDLEDEDGVYSDALDTLSPTDSFSMNYSASGLSGSDGPDEKPSGTFSTDPQTRDFMLSRFLPAAKAMALGPSRYPSRKQSAPTEQPREIKRMVSYDRKLLVNRNGSDTMALCVQKKEEAESEDEDCGYDYSGHQSAKGCGLLPRLCFKNSFCLLNPVPGIKLRAQVAESSAREIARPGKTAYIQSHSQTPQKLAWDAVDKPKLRYGARSGELHKVAKKQTGESSRFTRSGELQTTGRLSPYRCSRGAGVSPYRNETPRSPFRGVGFLGIPKDVENVKANRFGQYIEGTNKNKLVLGSISPAVEKILYVDAVNIPEVSSLSKGSTDSAAEDVDTSLESRGVEETSTTESVFQEIKCLNISNDGGIFETAVSIDADLSPTPAISHQRGQEATMEGSGQSQGLEKRSSSFECSKLTSEGNLNIGSYQILKADEIGNANASDEQCPVRPPLPKSPSESWLWRTLPSISSGNPFSHLKLGTRTLLRKQDPKTSSPNAKWETIVKSSRLHHDHVRYSEELITHISQQSIT